MHYWLYEIILSLYSDNNYNYLYFSYIVHKYPSSNICNNILNLNTYQYILPVYYQNVHYLCNVIYSLSKMTIYWHVLSNTCGLLSCMVLKFSYIFVLYVKFFQYTSIYVNGLIIQQLTFFTYCTIYIKGIFQKYHLLIYAKCILGNRFLINNSKYYLRISKMSIHYVISNIHEQIYTMFACFVRYVDQIF